MQDELDSNSTQTLVAKKFSLKHSFRAGAIVWVKDKRKNEDYYVVLKSHSRPARGIQLPGGRVEKLENVAEAVVREVYEETGIQTRILCPLGLVYLDNPVKSYSRVEIYYIVRPISLLNADWRWKHIDHDRSHQQLECWCVSTKEPLDYLAPGQDLAVDMFLQWLGEHKKPEIYYENERIQPVSPVNNTQRQVFQSKFNKKPNFKLKS